uniref:Disease resistance R13L4/SHOC-2-like LRR domain-containing protein n=1 Tax=Anopheles melas TaxID=34690 RepID=A0A182TJJ1_9DIPT
MQVGNIIYQYTRSYSRRRRSGQGDRMSRNKDKYESNNPRRQQTFLTAEDIAAGKKTCWHGIEITGSVRNLSPTLWKFEHLTALFLNDNCLTRLPHQIGQLANLRTLDLSANKLRSLPAELGELIQLRELLLNNNYLRVLPYELGKLFNLHVLGLHGNPLGKDVLSIYNEPNGTSKLLTYMLDNLSVYRKASDHFQDPQNQRFNGRNGFGCGKSFLFVFTYLFSSRTIASR